MQEIDTELQNNPINLPHIIMVHGVDPAITVNPAAAAETMRTLGIPETAIANSVLYIDPKNRLMNNGTHYTNRIGKLRFRSIPELANVNGDIVRISTKVRGKLRTEEQMNKTATHEWEHTAQTDRQDRKVTAGHVAIYGLASIGALAGNRLSKGIGAAIGGYLGYQLGYWIAPHERQARLRARTITSNTFVRE